MSRKHTKGESAYTLTASEILYTLNFYKGDCIATARSLKISDSFLKSKIHHDPAFLEFKNIKKRFFTCVVCKKRTEYMKGQFKKVKSELYGIRYSCLKC